MTVLSIQKRDGRIQPFEESKIASAISRAFAAMGRSDVALACELAAEVGEALRSRFAGRIPRVEDVQDEVERVLMDRGFTDVARAYILYRRDRAEVRAMKQSMGVHDDLKLSVNAAAVLKRRYLQRSEVGEVIETPAGMLRRVAEAVARPESIYNRSADLAGMAEDFYTAMSSLDLLPNSPTLMNAGTELGQLSACFVLPIEDSMSGIFGTLRDMALIHQSGGGTGFSFSRLRPKGDVVKSTRGIASGPVSFMRIYDSATEVVKQGGRRRGANMGILRVDHPDILEFITCKSDAEALANFNISVAVTDAFMDAVKSGSDYDLVNPRTGLAWKSVSARQVFDLIVTMAWQTGDPGLAFIDEINRHNPTPEIGTIESTNPCGEVPLLAYESCNLASINLAHVVKGGGIDYEKLGGLVRLGVRFLDNVIDETRFPLSAVETITRANRKIGLGVMGFAGMLIGLGISYDSEEAVDTASDVMSFIQNQARKASFDLAEDRGVFANYEGSVWSKLGLPQRNATVTSVAPTGTISIIASCSSGIEPLFAVSYVRDVLDGARLLEVDAAFERVARERGFYSRELMLDIARQGSVQRLDAVPDDVQRLFVTSMDIAPEWHVRMQAAFQAHCDNAVAKTVNLPKEATPEDIRRIYTMAHELKCKGITVYRYDSKPSQVLYVGSRLEAELSEREHIAVDSEFDGSCPTGDCGF